MGEEHEEGTETSIRATIEFSKPAIDTIRELAEKTGVPRRRIINQLILDAGTIRNELEKNPDYRIVVVDEKNTPLKQIILGPLNPEPGDNVLPFVRREPKK